MPMPAPLAAWVAACAPLGGGQLAAAAGAAGYASRADIPSGCELADEDKLPHDSRCLFNDQCSGGYCCPYFKVCQDQAFGDWSSDPLKLEILYAPAVGGEGTNGCGDGGTNVCDACAFRDTASDDSTTMCAEISGSMSGPVLTTSSQLYIDTFGLWDPTNAACNCDSRFLEYMLSDEWVPACGPPTLAPTPAPTAQVGCTEAVATGEYCSHWYHVGNSPGISSVAACRTAVQDECPTCVYFSYRASSEACHMGNPSSVDPTCSTWTSDGSDINIYAVFCVDTDVSVTPTPAPALDYIDSGLRINCFCSFLFLCMPFLW